VDWSIGLFRLVTHSTISSGTKMFKLGRIVKGFALYITLSTAYSTPKIRLEVEEHVIRYSSSTCKPSRYHRSLHSRCFVFFLSLVWSSSRTKMFKLGRM
jgi:hypothetical protein